MFTWICPQCGGEVLPSQDECPRCSKLAQPLPLKRHEEPAAAAVPPAQAPVPASVPQAPAPFPASVPQAPGAFPSSLPDSAPAPAFAAMAHSYQAHPEAPSTGMRDILVTVGVAILLLGGGYFLWMRGEGGEKHTKAAKTELETVKGGKRPHPLTKQIEVGGIRLRMTKQGQAEVQLVVINHSVADIANLTINVTLNAKGTGKEVAVFPVKVKRLGPMGSADVTAKATAEMSSIDMPDWQFLEAKFEIEDTER